MIKPTILIVEDEPALRRLWERVLEASYTVLTAAGLETAKAIFDEKKDEISIVVADLVLADEKGGSNHEPRGGYKFAEHALTLWRGRVILTAGDPTTLSSDEWNYLTKTLGVVRLDKPYGAPELLGRLKSVLHTLETSGGGRQRKLGIVPRNNCG